MLCCDLSGLCQIAAQSGGDVGHTNAHHCSLVQEQCVLLSRGSAAGGGVQGVDGTAPIVLQTDLIQQLQAKK